MQAGVFKAIANSQLVQRRGQVMQTQGNLITATLPRASLGELCLVNPDSRGHGGQHGRLAEVVGFSQTSVQLACLEASAGVGVGSAVTALGCRHQISVSQLRGGDVLDGFGRRLAASSSATGDAFCLNGEGYDVIRDAPSALDRPPIHKVLSTGVRVLDCMTTLGVGQRVGFFAGPGCGKSTLLAQIARGCEADHLVLALVGERGRELREWIDREFDDRTRSRCVFVCATSDRTAIERVRASFTATAIAEGFRDQGKSVVLMIDSLTRLARAQREIGLAAGEPLARGGFTPSVYALLPTLIERAGCYLHGDITGLYTVLLEGEQISDDPIASEAKSLLDGHIVLRGALAQRGQYPAVSVPESLSRVMSHLVDKSQIKVTQEIRSMYASAESVDLLLKLNEYKTGSDPQIDRALTCMPKIEALFRQPTDELTAMADAVSRLHKVVQP